MSVVENILGVLAYCFAISLAGLAVFLSTKIFKMIDLSCQSSLALGGCVYGSMVLAGVNPLLAILTAMVIGYLVGMITASLISYIKLNSIIASLLTVGGLQSLLVKLDELKRINESTVFGNLSPVSNFILAFVIVAIVVFLLYNLLVSEYGLAMRIYGDGEIITESMGIDGIRSLSIGLGIENALSALSGALLAQIMGDFSENMGNGIIVFGIAAIILGEKIVGNSTIRAAIFGVVFGSVCVEMMLKFMTSPDIIGLDKEYDHIITAITLIMMVALKQENFKYIKEVERKEI